ncbi:hypothetical protein L345_15298, partial [Ophiophagus hannah]
MEQTKWRRTSEDTELSLCDMIRHGCGRLTQVDYVTCFYTAFLLICMPRRGHPDTHIGDEKTEPDLSSLHRCGATTRSLTVNSLDGFLEIGGKLSPGNDKNGRGGTGQSVDQISGIVIVTEGQSLFLRCAYEAQFSGMKFPFWYIQHPGGSTGQLVKQASGILFVSERQLLSLYCSYETEFISSSYTYWYIQHPGQPLKLLLTEKDNEVQGFYATLHEGKRNGTFNLEKDVSQLKDSAVCFCAIRDTMR